MKKILAFFLCFTMILSFSACSEEETQEQKLKEGEAFAEKYLNLMLNGKLSEVDSLMVIDTRTFVEVCNEQIPGDIGFDGQKIEIDGETFDSVEKFIEAAEQRLSVIKLISIKKKDTRSVTREEFEEKILTNKYNEAFFAKFSEDALKNIYSVSFDVTIGAGDEARSGIVNTLITYEKDQWKAISPTWTGWYILGYDIMR